MRRPLDWFVVALSLAILFLGRSMAVPEKSRPALVLLPEPQSVRAPRAEVLPFEPTGAVAVPAGRRQERNLEFGYVRLEPAARD